MNYDSYESPFCTRYASSEMQYIFSARKKFTTFRKLWTALARAENKLGLPVTEEQVSELESHTEITDEEMKIAEERENLVRHDVMAHVYSYGQTCVKAAGIIHLGATSCYVGDNTDIIIMRDGMNLIRKKLLNVIKNLAEFAIKWKDFPCLAYTHLQPAQPTTVGKRASLWLNEFFMDFEELEYRISTLKLLGQKGTTGTQASFAELFAKDGQSIHSEVLSNGDKAELAELLEKLEKMIAAEMDFIDENGNAKVVPVSGQTYSRKFDSNVLGTLSGIAQSAMKFSNDIRILANFKEIEEPFEKNQIGSSAMPYKRNPMRCERITSLSRYVITNSLNPALTAGTQWFERTLDDSANKRISSAEAFLGIDAILNLMINVTSGLVVYPEVITSRLKKELPFMAAENIMMDAVKKGGNRQELHEKIREHSVESAKIIKEKGRENDLIERISSDRAFGVSKEEIYAILKPENYTGISAFQTENFIENYINPILDKNKNCIGITAELKV